MNPRMLVKVGPSIGLLGTLIPMGTSLASLATGNLEAMAGQMVVAFTTTIIGLATGTLAYVVAAVGQGWVTEPIHEQRFLAERLAIELGDVAGRTSWHGGSADVPLSASASRRKNRSKKIRSPASPTSSTCRSCSSSA